jgi:endonuclease I
MARCCKSSLVVVLSLLGCCFSAGPARAEIPPAYYDAATGLSGGELKQALHQIIRQHTVVPYGNVPAALRDIWRDPTNDSNIQLIYSSSSVDAYSNWNREHLWPRARGNAEQAGPDESDLFHVVPADVGVNSLRGSLYFDFSDLTDPKYGIGSGGAAQFSYDSDSFQPPPEQRGDIARAMFYMDVRYNGSELNTSDLELVSIVPSGPQMANLNTLLLWHAADPPDEAERVRNDIIYFSYQGNRNPFIDRPELVAAIWGDGTPGNLLSAPLARVGAISATAVESPPGPARFLVSLNQFAGAEGVTLKFSMSGQAISSEYSLSVQGLGVVTYDPANGTGSLQIPAGYATATILLTPNVDNLEEGPETARLNLVLGSGYQLTPDASAYATITIQDAPSFPVSWNFDSVATTNKTLTANVGQGSLSLSNWGGSFTNYSGRTSSSLGLVAGPGMAGNGTSVDFNFSMTGFRSLSLSFYTQGTSGGFNSGFWSASTDGINFTTNTSTNTARTSSGFVSRFVDFSFLSWLNDAANVIIRYTLSGATSTNGNNRIDDLVFSAVPLSSGSVVANDLFTDASLLEGAEATATGSNVGATREAGEPLHFNTGTASVWWRWTASANGVVSIATTGSSFDTVLAVYTGNSVGALTRVASDDDSGGGYSSRVTFNAVAGTTYRIAVDGYGPATGSVSLSLVRSSLPIVNSFSPSLGRAGTTVSVSGNNLSAVTGVRFGGVSATSFTKLSDNELVAVVPAGAASGVISLVSGSGTGQSSSWFRVTLAPGIPSASPDSSNIVGLSTVQGGASVSYVFRVSAESMPGTLRISAPQGFEVSLDGQSFADALEVSAPQRLDSASNYAFGSTNWANAGNGFENWSVWTQQGTGAAGAVVANPVESGVTGFGDRALSLFATPASSSAYAYASRRFRSPLAVGDIFSLRWAVNWDPNTSSGYNYFNLGSGGASLLTVWQGSNPGSIYFYAPGVSTVDTGIPHGTGPMTWSFELIAEDTLRVTATRRDGSSEILFARDITVAGAPDYFVWHAYQLDADIKRRLYFNDLRIDSASPGGGRLPSTMVYVRLAATASAGNLSGPISLTSGGQALGSVNVSGTVTGGSAYDEWVRSHNLDPQGNGAAAADPDGDGHSNRLEFAFGRSPVASDPSLLQMTTTTLAMTIRYLARTSGYTYTIQRSTDLLTGFVEASGVVPVVSESQDGAPSGWRRMEFSVPASGSAFYRIETNGE